MVGLITNFSKKSFKDYSMEEKLKFNDINIFYGINGRGKTSLARGIKEEIEKTEHDNLRYFYSDYIDELLLLEDSNKFKGVKATFGEKDVKIENEINELNKQIIDISNNEEELMEKRKRLRQKIDEIHKSRKGNLNIPVKASNKSIEDVIKLYQKNLEAAKKIEPDLNRLKSFLGDNEALQNHYNRIYEINIPNLTIEEYETTKIVEILQKDYSDTKIPSYEVVEWLRNGLILHDKEDSVCKFCDNKFDYSGIEEKVNMYLSNEKQNDSNYLIKVKSSIELILKNYEQYILNFEKNAFFTNELKIKKTEEDLKEQLVEIIKILNIKIDNMENKNLNFSADNYTILMNKLKNIEENFREKKKSKLEDLMKRIENITKILTGSISLEIIENQTIKEELSNIQKEEEKCRKQKELNKKIKLKVKQLRENQSDYNDFKNYLNEVFESINLHIRLESDDSTDSYYLYHPIEEIKLNVKDISEGEKNLIAFLFFYFELFDDDNQKNIKSNITELIIDDPINSFDESNRFYVLELIKNIIKSNINQIFIFTHSWNDFCDITYGLKGEKNNFYEIRKNYKGASFLEKIEKTKTPYKKLFQEIYELSRKKEELIKNEDCYYYHTINSIRRVFEEFLSFKLKNNKLPQKSNQPEIEEVYRIMTQKEMSGRKKRDLGAFLTNINILSHQPYRAIDVINSAKFLMKYIEDVDKVHFNAMKD
ncbi:MULTISPECIES: AAA family ATPase [Staphylococcus]|uniref:AAA family ATPase n=1 Tax=Staphylococcus borealis TaxID=2742203 RepID=A0ABX2LW66_9STAP|nr:MULTISPECIES: AAA family ATPase [Staphylococcus]MUN94911.1 AAA family ATPase [Staphylococcus borealis]NUI83430.1 AAA family ATPase [Staphylococcus borealis]NUI83631.1 AAA family ATPase [Staphylococcus borealis]NUI92824.1 AAA family ATPase [Staphylococcus borealis]